MGSLLKHIGAMLALVGSMPSLAVAQTDPLCTYGATPNEKVALNFQVSPAMVVHDGALREVPAGRLDLADGILDVTFADANLVNPHGPATDRLFSFSHTIGTILDSAGAKSMLTEEEKANNVRDPKEVLVDSMIRSFDNNDGLLINPSSGVLIPVDDRFDTAGGGRQGEGRLDPAALLGADQQFAMKPLALFNRLDLAPADWSNCGEYRIVYAIPNGGFQKRFLLIFEASLPNPAFVSGNPAQSAEGCRPVARFWASLSNDPSARIENARQLHELYYLGKEGITSAPPATGQSPRPRPIVSFRNYGGDGGRGQVRANIFFEGGWQLREWLTQLNVGPTGPGITFVPETVKDNPLAELYLDDPAGTLFSTSNIPSLVGGLQRDFIEHFASVIHNNLLVERSAKYREHVRDIARYAVDDVTEDTIVTTTLGLGASNRFNEYQSVSNPVAQSELDEPSKLAGPKFRRTLEYLFKIPGLSNPANSAGGSQVSLDIILNRAEAGTCAGCHQTSPRDGLVFHPAMIRVKSELVDNQRVNRVVEWPDVALGGFVHVREDRKLSPALTDHFLPVRRYLMGRYLCPLQEGMRISTAVPTRSASPKEPFRLDALLEQYTAAQPTALVPMTINSNVPDVPPVGILADLPVSTQEEAVEAARVEIMKAREAERSQPGALVEARRPH